MVEDSKKSDTLPSKSDVRINRSGSGNDNEKFMIYVAGPDGKLRIFKIRSSMPLTRILKKIGRIANIKPMVNWIFF